VGKLTATCRKLTKPFGGVMHILVTNDDGVQARGLLALAQACRTLGDVTVLAPDRNWSASGHVKTMHRPLRVRDVQLADGSAALSTDGAPSDCVALAVLGLLDRPIDLVVSGINPHANIGHDVTYSGTVTAAMEAAIAALPGFAISLDSPAGFKNPLDYQPGAEIAVDLVRQTMSTSHEDGLLLNINVPYGPRDEMKGVAITRQGLRVYRDALVARNDPRGRPYYWIGGDAPTGHSSPDTDFWALENKLVSVTPLQLDLTDQPRIEALASLDLQV
jgi:5'-nucleotidase